MESDSAVETNPDDTPAKTYTDGVVDTVTVVSICALLVDAYGIWFMIPRFKDIFKSLSVDLPLSTKIF